MLKRIGVAIGAAALMSCTLGGVAHADPSTRTVHWVNYIWTGPSYDYGPVYSRATCNFGETPGATISNIEAPTDWTVSTYAPWTEDNVLGIEITEPDGYHATNTLNEIEFDFTCTTNE